MQKALANCITAIELHRASYEHARELVTDMLVAKGVPAAKGSFRRPRLIVR